MSDWLKGIYGIQIQPLKRIVDERGSILEMFTENQGEFWRPIRHSYLSCVHPGVVKAWHFHKTQEDAFTCIAGAVKLALFDCRPDSPTRGEVRDLVLSAEAPTTIRIPSGVLHGFKGLDITISSLIVNNCSHPYCYAIPDEFRVHPHDPFQQGRDFEQLGLDFDHVPYSWARKDG